VSEPLIFAIPSKGRLKEQVEDWLADCGLAVRAFGGSRGYSASLQGQEAIQVRLASAADIAQSLIAGDIHLGVTGEDLLREASPTLGRDAMLLMALGFGRADLVVAAPQSWIDVETMADVDDVAHDILARTGRRMRVATKYLVQTRAFFVAHGIADYRIVESGGATEGAPAAGAAELVVDITSSGATLAANGLKILTDGLILKSEARLAASLAAPWDEARLETCRAFLSILEARGRSRSMASLVWPAGQDEAARRAVSPFAQAAQAERAHGALVAQTDLFAAARALTIAKVGPVTVSYPAYVFEPRSAVWEALAARVVHV
jgi:ATP phosphoribosyltransferase